MKHVIAVAILGFMVSVLGVCIYSQEAYAANGSCFFAAGTYSNGTRNITIDGGECSVDGQGDIGTNDVLSGRPNKNAIPSTVYSDPNSIDRNFVDFIIDKYQNGKDQDVVGAAFLITQLNNKKSWPTESDIIEFRRLINLPEVKVGFVDSEKVGRTSYYMPNKKNVFYGAHDEVSRPVITITVKGQRLATIETWCGNMTVDSPDYKLLTTKAYISVDKTSAKPGETVTWTYRGEVTYRLLTDLVPYIKSSSDWPGGTNTLGPIGNSFTQSKTFTNADIGKKFCSKTVIDPGFYVWIKYPKWESTTTVESDYVCVTVSETAISEPCRPVKKTLEAATYPAQDNGYVRVTSYTPTYRAKTDNYSDPTVYTGRVIWQTNDLTTKNTDGNVHTITLADTTNHVAWLETKTHILYRSIDQRTRSWVSSTIWVTDPGGRTVLNTRYNPITGQTEYEVDSSGWGVWSGWSVYQEIWRYDSQGGIPSLPSNSDSTEYRYSTDAPSYWYTVVHYSDGDTRDVPSGNALTYTNNVGAERNPASSPVGPCFDYSLTSSINSVGATLESGASINVNPSMVSVSFTQTANSSFWNIYRTHSKSKQTLWQVNKLVIAPGVSLPNAVGNSKDSTQDPCDYYDPSGLASSCDVYQQGTTVVETSGATSSNLSSVYTVPDVRAGTKICFVFSVRPDRSDPTYWSTSPDTWYWNHAAYDPSANCLLVVKKPKVQVWGGDVYVGRSLNGTQGTSIVETSQSLKSGVTYGSWAEYGLLASGSISGSGSGSSLSGGKSSATSCTIAQLTFTNTAAKKLACDGTSFGGYKFGTNMKNLSGYFETEKARTPETNFRVDSSKSDTYYDKDLKSLNIVGGTVSKSIIINIPNADVTISGDIVYQSKTISSLTDLPQMMIIAKNIYISSSVSRIDSWLIAPTGKINTCIEAGERNPLTVYTCSALLQINGPVVADQLYLRRTAGSNPREESGDPAEIINLRSDAYLWMYGKSLGDNRLRSTYVVELPPRL